MKAVYYEIMACYRSRLVWRTFDTFESVGIQKYPNGCTLLLQCNPNFFLEFFLLWHFYYHQNKERFHQYIKLLVVFTKSFIFFYIRFQPVRICSFNFKVDSNCEPIKLEIPQRAKQFVSIVQLTFCQLSDTN